MFALNELFRDLKQAYDQLDEESVEFYEKFLPSMDSPEPDKNIRLEALHSFFFLPSTEKLSPACFTQPFESNPYRLEYFILNLTGRVIGGCIIPLCRLGLAIYNLLATCLYLLYQDTTSAEETAKKAVFDVILAILVAIFMPINVTICIIQRLSRSIATWFSTGPDTEYQHIMCKSSFSDHYNNIKNAESGWDTLPCKQYSDNLVLWQPYADNKAWQEQLKKSTFLPLYNLALCLIMCMIAVYLFVEAIDQCITGNPSTALQLSLNAFYLLAIGLISGLMAPINFVVYTTAGLTQAASTAHAYFQP